MKNHPSGDSMAPIWLHRCKNGKENRFERQTFEATSSASHGTVVDWVETTTATPEAKSAW
jgi:hypothetical protein